MTIQTLQSIVDEAVLLDREITERTARLKGLKSDLVKEARLHLRECTPTKGGGKSWTIYGHDGCIARVTFPGKSLKSTIEEVSLLEKVREAAGRMFDRLFRPAVAYDPIADFREEAVSLLGEEKGGELIALCESTSSTRVSFETALHEADR